MLMKCFWQLVSLVLQSVALIFDNFIIAKKLPKVDPATTRQGTGTGQRGGNGGRVIDVTHEESSGQGGCCKN